MVQRFIYKTITGIAFLLVSAPVLAQIPDSSLNALVPQMELLTEHLDSEVDFSDVTDDFESLLNNPVRINSNDINELRRLFFIRETQIRKLYEYHFLYGDVSNEFELMAIPGFDTLTIKRMMPYISFSAPSKSEISYKNLLKRGKSNLLIRYQRNLEKAAGYYSNNDSIPAAYKGTPDRMLLKYSFDSKGKLRLGLLAEKDPGEVWFNNSNPPGFDFYSAYISLKDIGIFHKIIIGDYHLRFGQGLTLWSGFSFGKQGFGAPLTKAQGLRPSTSSAEYGYLRGIASTVRLSKTEISAFIAINTLDAKSDTLDSNVYLSTVYETGLHRTESEMITKNLGKQRTEGANVTYRGAFFRSGITYVQSTFNPGLSPKPELYRKYIFNGDRFSKIGLDAAMVLKSIEIAGEISRSNNGSIAWLVRANWEPDTRFMLWTVYRHYPPEFTSIFSNAFGENSSNANESGFFAGFRLYPAARLKIEGYADYFRFPWLKYRVDSPSDGYEYQCLMVWNPNRRLEFTTRWRYSEKPQNFLDSPRPINISGQTRQHTARLHIKYRHDNTIELSTRAEFTTRSAPNSPFRDGSMIYQEFAWKPLNKKWTLHMRYTRFTSYSYDERLYAYEQDVLYAFSIPSYYYDGSRVYGLVKYQVSKSLAFWVRAASTIFHDREFTGSGNDLISGNTKTEIKVQMQWKF